jgi:succinate-acetate transporter protein
MSPPDHNGESAAGARTAERPEPGRRIAEPAYAGDARPPARVFLQPIAAPSILGLYGFAGATFMAAAHLAGIYSLGGSTTRTFAAIAPFCLTFGGIAQFAAALWSYRARDGLATAVHGMWGSFWIAFGILFLMEAAGVRILGAGDHPAYAFWFCVLAAITFCCALAACWESLGLVAVLLCLAVGSVFTALAEFLNDNQWASAAGWVLIASSAFAVYTATAIMLEGTSGRTILPLGKNLPFGGFNREANVPGGTPTVPVQYERGEPGVRQGQ